MEMNQQIDTKALWEQMANEAVIKQIEEIEKEILAQELAEHLAIEIIKMNNYNLNFFIQHLVRD